MFVSLKQTADVLFVSLNVVTDATLPHPVSLIPLCSRMERAASEEQDARPAKRARADATDVDVDERPTKRARPDATVDEIMARNPVDRLKVETVSAELARRDRVQLAAARVWEHAVGLQPWKVLCAQPGGIMVNMSISVPLEEVQIEPATPDEICVALKKLVPGLAYATYHVGAKVFRLAVNL
jgi:hypothetical protein